MAWMNAQLFCLDVDPEDGCYHARCEEEACVRLVHGGRGEMAGLLCRMHPAVVQQGLGGSFPVRQVPEVVAICQVCSLCALADSDCRPHATKEATARRSKGTAGTLQSHEAGASLPQGVSLFLFFYIYFIYLFID